MKASARKSIHGFVTCLQVQEQSPTARLDWKLCQTSEQHWQKIQHQVRSDAGNVACLDCSTECCNTYLRVFPQCFSRLCAVESHCWNAEPYNTRSFLLELKSGGSDLRKLWGWCVAVWISTATYTPSCETRMSTHICDIYTLFVLKHIFTLTIDTPFIQTCIYM